MGPPGGRLCTRLSEHSATARAVTRDSYRSWPGTGKFRAANQGRGSLECGGPLASLKLLQAPRPIGRFRKLSTGTGRDVNRSKLFGD
jgi:hypothetical protein